MSNLLSQVQKLQDEGGLDKALDLIYETIDRMFWASSFAETDELLNQIDVENIDLNILIGWLTVTSWAADRLKNRKEFYQKVEAAARKHPEWEEGLLKGLE